MDQALRNKLRRAVEEMRRTLERDVTEQLEGTYGITAERQGANGTTPVRLEAADEVATLREYPQRRQERLEIEAAIRHEATKTPGLAKGIEDLAGGVARFAREAAFTSLNRLAALKLMEARGMLRPSIGQGPQSSGFREFQMVSPELQRAHADGGYRLYLELLFDDVSAEIAVLFDRSTPQSHLFPTPLALFAVLERLNDPELAVVWDEDETIGWIYQYFTPKEQREQARKESAAPRNSYELAFRNQFYTPRYVVEFLSDNTLGRTWWEMRQGRTALADTCSYMVRRKHAIFLGPGEAVPTTDDDITTEHVAHRAKKDPREIRVLDPACGSGHFLLYCFGLLQTIYEEAYDDADLGPKLQREQPDRAAFGRQVPALILRHNLHGIDIDLRATQIAALALWLRAQRAYAELAIPPQQRPRITKGNLVCAEPMPGEYPLLEEYLGAIELPLADLVKQVWLDMQLAAEAGSLLRIERAMEEKVDQARHRAFVRRPYVRAGLPGMEQPVRVELPGLASSDAEGFWAQAEEKLLAALEDYANRATNGQTTQRQLFADDAAHGFAFIDLCRQRYDVVLMNPPFGETSRPSKAYIEKTYPRTKNDLYAAFVECWLDRLIPHGLLGAITSRTGFFLSSFQKWREEILLREARVTVMADLGQGVLDTAMVETAAYVLERQTVDR
jgi:hypothetical protein